MYEGDESSGAASDLFVRILTELDGPASIPEVERRNCEAFPHLAAEIRLILARHRVLDLAADEPSPPCPERLGDFRIVREIGRGGMGMIYEAVQEPLARRVAVKTIRSDYGRASLDAEARFLREQAVLARLHHTHIVPIHAAGRDGPLRYYAMDFIRGVSLNHLIRSVREVGSSRTGEETPTLGETAKGGAPAAGATHQAPNDQACDRPAVGWAHRLRLSGKYLHSVARVIEDAAVALQHAHDAGICHRDVKPSNLMVDDKEHCWVLDFGLAGVLPGPVGAETFAHPDEFCPDPLSRADGVKGTPQYMAPEQFEGRADERSDVWGLGVTLYELLTLRPAFSGANLKAIDAKVRRVDPTPIEDLVANVPPDLAAICRKAMRKDPGERYESARELAADLRRWRNNEPTRARPARVVRRVALWSRRNPGWAIAIALGIFSVLGGGATLVSHWRMRAMEAHRSSLLHSLQFLRRGVNPAGWREDTERRIRESALAIDKGGDPDGRLQSQAAAALAGLDATRTKIFSGYSRSLVFDRDGKRLLMGEMSDGEGPSSTLLWDGSDALPRRTSQVGSGGGVSFRDDGTPLQIAFDREHRSLLLRDVATDRRVRRLAIPLDDIEEPPILSLTPDGAWVAALVPQKEAPCRIFVWDLRTGELKLTLLQQARVIGISPDGRLLAWSHEGWVTVWSLSRGETIAHLATGQNRVLCMAFGRDSWKGADASPGWVLASGDAGGTVTVWDLATEIPRAFCRGSNHRIHCVAFSPDGMTLASAGYGHDRLWDVTSGRPLIELGHAHNDATALAFSPDGGRLARSGRKHFGGDDLTEVFELHDGEGIRTLRGLSTQVEKVIFSPDGRLIAAISHDWRVGIWARRTGWLIHVLESPPGRVTAAAGLAFSPDSRRFALAAGHEARLWTLDTGRVERRWALPEGLNDNLAFHGDGRLLSLRTETDDPAIPPYDTDPSRYPRVGRLRDLMAEAPLTPLREIRDYHRHIFSSALSADGRYFVIEGLGGPEGKTRLVNLYAGPTGTTIGPPATRLPTSTGAFFRFDPTGAVLVHLNGFRNGPRARQLVELPGRVSFGEFPPVECLSPLANKYVSLYINQDWPDRLTPTVDIYERNRGVAVLRIAVDGPEISPYPQFSPDLAGRHVAWGNQDGSVSVADLEELRRRLNAFGLGW